MPFVENSGGSGVGAVTSVFARTGAVVAAEADYTLTLLGDVTLATPAAGQSLGFDGTVWANALQAGQDGTVPTGAKGHTLTRLVQFSSQSALSSQRVSMFSIWLFAGVTITSITFVSGTQALVGGNHQLFGIYDDNAGSSSGTARALLRGTSDDTSTAWAANTAKTLSLSSTYTPTRTGQFFLAILVDAGTVPSLSCTSPSTTAVNVIAPIPAGTSNTGVTALPNPANALSVSTVAAYAYWS